MQGRHAKDPLSVGQLEVAHLENVGQGLQDVDDAHQDEHQGNIQGEGQSAHRSPQKERASVAHKDLGGVEVIDQESAQPTEQPGGEDPQLQLPPEAGHGGEKEHHGHGDAGDQAVDAVGDIDGVHGAHHDEGGEHHINGPGEGQGHVHKGDVKVGGQIVVVAHQHREHDGRRQLEQKLLRCGQAGVLVLFHLHIVVNIADHAEHQGEQEHKAAAEAPCGKVRPPQQQNRRSGADDEHQPSHGGRPLLRHVPGGADLLDGLPGLHAPQQGDEPLPAQGGRRKGHHKADYNP